MATKDNNVGLLSKVAMFVRNPTKDWSDLERPEVDSEQNTGYSKEVLKEMIERKRQNDFVRRREFDMLRKLRRNEPVITLESGGRPSFFQSSLAANQGERAMTIKKIDEIEAQMSKQWWKGKQDDAPHAAPVVLTQGEPVPPPRPTLGADDAAIMAYFPSEAENTFAPTQPIEHLIDTRDMLTTEYEATRPGLASNGEELLAPIRASKQPESRNFEPGMSEFSAADLLSVELGDDLADADLEEASIRFANFDDAGAEATLLNALGAPEVSLASAESWAMALFDLYRATGQEMNFDRVAIEYAQRFGRSAPAWFSTPDLLRLPAGRGVVKGATVSAPAATGAPALSFIWECPALLDVQALHDLATDLAAAPMPWYFNWIQLETVAPEAAQGLAQLFAQWCERPVRLQFGGVSALESVLRRQTPSGDASVAACWWQLRLDVMRVLKQQDEFELAALDYCVTYEVSPPSWKPVRCEYVYEPVQMLSASTTLASAPESALVPAKDGAAPRVTTLPPELETVPVATVALSGEVLGDAEGVLNQLAEGSRSDSLRVSCVNLIRVDFAAAGSILNWVTARHAEGCSIQFIEVPRLVAAFFTVIGISEHARVMLRMK